MNIKFIQQWAGPEPLDVKEGVTGRFEGRFVQEREAPQNRRAELADRAEMLCEEGMPAYEAFLDDEEQVHDIDIQDWIRSVQRAETDTRMCELEIDTVQTKAGHFDTLCRLLSHY